LIIFASVASLILAMMWSTVWFVLIEDSQYRPNIRTGLQVLFIAAYMLQIARLVLLRHRGELRWLVIPAFFLMGLISHLFLAALLKEFVWTLWVWYSQNGEGHRGFNETVIALCGFANIWGTWTALKGPELQTAEIPVPEWSQGESIRITQISDLHVGPIIKRKYVQEVVDKINALHADLVVITGDLGDGDVGDLLGDLEPLRRIVAPRGVYFVTGNHEYYWNASAWTTAVKNLGIQVLENKGVAISGLWLGGVPDVSAHHFAGGVVSDPKQALIGSEPWQFKVLLAHQPKSAIAAETAGFNLMLSGHTHKGQFFPFNFLVGFFNPHVQGLERRNQMWVYVNQGTGFWGPPLRLGVPSEITLLTLKGTSERPQQRL
jgi:predicted MPP superfamily phosphohydrolase